MLELLSLLLEALKSSLAPLSGHSVLAQVVTALVTIPIAAIAANVAQQLVIPRRAADPPVVFHWVPFVGSAIPYGNDPVKFLFECREKYGNVFTMILLGKRMTIALGPKGSNFILGGKSMVFNAADAYRPFTTPVFGKDVVYDAPNDKFMEQKKFVKAGLSITNLRAYVRMIEEEVADYLAKDPAFKPHQALVSPDSKWDGQFDVLRAMQEITILTAARTLQGKEVRDNLDKGYAALYADLDGGFTPIHMMFPYLPLESSRKRDRAQKLMQKFYVDIIRKRTASGEFGSGKQENLEDGYDMLSTLLGQQYRDGQELKEYEIANLMIVMLMGGQHTSSGTSAWALLHLANNPDVAEALYKEQVQHFGTVHADGKVEFRSMTFEEVRALPLMDCVLRETLRIHPPFHCILRYVREDTAVSPELATESYVVPKGHYVMASPIISQMDPLIWDSPEKWDPSRWNDPEGVAAEAYKVYLDENGEKVDYGFGKVSKGSDSPYQPFGAGRHRCIGEQYAYMQLGTILAVIVRNFELWIDRVPEVDYHTMIALPKEPQSAHVRVAWRRRKRPHDQNAVASNEIEPASQIGHQPPLLPAVMFKGILPGKRVSSTDFTNLTQLADIPPGKENVPNGSIGVQQPLGKPPKSGLSMGKKKKKSAETKKNKAQQPEDKPDTDVAFDKLLDELQIPTTLRPKLLGMDASVKAAMLKTSHVITEKTAPAVGAFALPATPPRNNSVGLRRVHSTESLGSPRAPFMHEDNFESPRKAGSPTHVSAHQSPYGSGRPYGQRQGSGHWTGGSVDMGRLFSKSHITLPSMSTLDLASGAKVTKDKNGTVKNLSPTRFCSILQGQSSLHMDVEDIKKLRLMLRNESASWTEEFCTLGGYSALLTRLNELLEVEWREEQHDDQVLHELLRCFKALSTSSIGCFALRSSCPTPYVQLVSLIYSDKKPGDVATRQLIVDLLLILFELYPPSSLPSTSKQGSLLSGRTRQHREAWETQTSLATSNVITLPAPHHSFFSFIRSLLLTPAPRPVEAPEVPVSPHEFIESLHVPRVYKAYLQEMSDVCRDYFWVFCHPNNTIWVLAETDETRVEKPKAPSGMTGGVEFEAMCYFTTHLRFINAVAASAADLNLPKENELSAYRFHSDLFLSGLERIILISRKASTTYYPTLHLELSRYVNHAVKSGYELPYTVSRLVGSPPIAVLKNPTASLAPPLPARNNGGSRSAGPSTPTRPKGAGAPATHVGLGHLPRFGSGAPSPLPSPRKMDPIKFD